VAPVNRIPSEILVLIPDFWDKGGYDTDEDLVALVALTHVCQAWREMFISRASLWTNLDCVGKARTRVYLERSKSLPLNLSLHTEHTLPPCHPFFEIIPHAVGRLKSLSIEAAPDDLEDITAHLSHPAPLLEKLLIRSSYDYGYRNPVLMPTLFNGDLSSLRALELGSVRTELPWRNMVNLTSLKLFRTSLGGVSFREFLDFLGSAPHLREVDLHSATPTPGAQNGRLVSLPCLESMEITGYDSAPLLLDHLLIPAGTRLDMVIELPIPPIKDHLRFLDNLRNFPDFTDIDLHIAKRYTRIQFSGPNGQVGMIPRSSRVDKTCLVVEFLDHFDMSKVERLEIHCRDSSSSDPPYRALLPMERLRTLTLYHCASPHIFIHALHPTMSSSGTIVCPELEELVVVLDNEMLDMKSVIGTVAARALKGAKLKSVKIIGQDQPERAEALELEKHVLHVECGDDIDEEG
jgi:hypothetical protein